MRKEIYITRGNICALGVITVICLVYFGALLYRLILVPNGPVHEFDNHVNYAALMQGERKIVSPHFLFHILTIAMQGLVSKLGAPNYTIVSQNEEYSYDWGLSGLIITLIFYILTVWALAIYLWHRGAFRDLPFWHCCYIAFFLSIVTPVFLFAPWDGLFYLGYITPSALYIIPTQIVLKLPSVLTFILSVRLFRRETNAVNHIVLTCFFVVMSGLAKPNFLLILLPSIFILSLYFMCANQSFDRKGVCVVVATVITVLLWQYYFKFLNDDPHVYKSEIILTAPFEILRHYSNFILAKLVLSVAFPLYVALVFWKTAQKDLLVLYGWLLFMVGMFFTAFVGESGPYLLAGNFGWSGQIGCLMIFVASTATFFCDIVPTSRRHLAVRMGIGLFSLHVCCGIIYYIRSFNLPYH